MTHIDVIKSSKLNSNVLILPPGQLDRKLYQDTAKALEGIGGKWNKKAGGFLFENDPTELIDQICNGVKRNLKKETQFFETPQDVADFMACELMYQSGQSVLEPSAGKGALIDAFIRENGGKAGIELFYIEKDADRNRFLQTKYSKTGFYHIHPLNDDFLQLDALYNERKEPISRFDYILANPPFTKNQDIDHIRKMWEHLKPGGRIVTVASKHWQFASGKKEQAFKSWIENEVEASVYDLESGRFKKSGTMVAACILVIDKPSKHNAPLVKDPPGRR